MEEYGTDSADYSVILSRQVLHNRQEISSAVADSTLHFQQETMHQYVVLPTRKKLSVTY